MVMVARLGQPAKAPSPRFGDAIRDGDAGHVTQACQVTLVAQVINKG